LNYFSLLKEFSPGGQHNVLIDFSPEDGVQFTSQLKTTELFEVAYAES
jgi:hypothetical protein